MAETSKYDAARISRLRTIRDYANQVVLVFGRDAFLPIDFGTGIESIVVLPRTVSRMGTGMTDEEVLKDLARWERYRKSVVKLIRPAVIPIATASRVGED